MHLGLFFYVPFQPTIFYAHSYLIDVGGDQDGKQHNHSIRFRHEFGWRPG